MRRSNLWQANMPGCRGGAPCRGSGCPRKTLFSPFCAPPQTAGEERRFGMTHVSQHLGGTVKRTWLDRLLCFFYNSLKKHYITMWGQRQQELIGSIGKGVSYGQADRTASGTLL